LKLKPDLDPEHEKLYEHVPDAHLIVQFIVTSSVKLNLVVL